MRKYILLFASLGFTLFIILQFWFSFIGLSFWQVKELVIKNNDYLPISLVEEKIKLEPGCSVFSVNLRRIKAELLKIPNIKDLKIKREYPDKIIVELIIRQPVFVFNINQYCWLTDTDGVILNRAELTPDRHAVLFEVNGLSSIADIKKTIKELTPLIDILKNNFSEKVIINITNITDLELVFFDKLTVKIGEAVFLEKKVNSLLQLLKVFKEEGVTIEQIVYMDLCSYQNPAVRFRN